MIAITIFLLGAVLFFGGIALYSVPVAAIIGGLCLMILSASIPDREEPR